MINGRTTNCFMPETHADWSRHKHSPGPHTQTQAIPRFYSQLPWRACSTWTAAADLSAPGRTAPCTPHRTSGCPGPSPSPLRCCCSAPAPRWSECGPPWSAPSAHTGCTAARCCSGCMSTWAQNGEDEGLGMGRSRWCGGQELPFLLGIKSIFLSTTLYADLRQVLLLGLVFFVMSTGLDVARQLYLHVSEQGHHLKLKSTAKDGSNSCHVHNYKSGFKRC